MELWAAPVGAPSALFYPRPGWLGVTPATCRVRAMGAEVCWVMSPFCPPRRHCRNGATMVVGLTGHACGAMVVLQVVLGLHFGRGIAEAAGSELLLHGRERAAGMRFNRAKAFTDTPVGGDGGGVLEALFLALGCPCGVPCPVARGPRGENLVQLWTSDDSIIGVVPFLEASFPETRLGLWQCWCYCPCTVAVEVRWLHVGDKVQRAHGCWRPWAGAYSATVIPVMAWRR